MPSGAKRESRARRRREGSPARFEDGRQVSHCGPVELAPRQHDPTLLVRRAVGEVDLLVLGEARVQRHLQQPGELPRVTHVGDTRDGCRVEDSIPEDPESSGAFGHKHVAVRQEGHAPRMGQLGREHPHQDVRLGCRMKQLDPFRKAHR